MKGTRTIAVALLAGSLLVCGRADAGLTGPAKLGSTDSGWGASYVGVEDSGGFYVGADVETILAEIQNWSRVRQMTSGAKVGTTSGWTVDPASDRAGLALCPASQTAATLVVPLDLPVNAILTGYTVRGQVESAGNTATLDASLRKLTVATAGITDAAVTSGAITQVSVTADAQIAATVSGLSELIAAGTTYYVLLAATTAAATDFDITSIDVNLTGL